MNRIYTCYNCGFVWKCDENHIPNVCPTCGLGPEYYLSEPGEDISKRRIHVDPPKPIATIPAIIRRVIFPHIRATDVSAVSCSATMTIRQR